MLDRVMKRVRMRAAKFLAGALDSESSVPEPVVVKDDLGAVLTELQCAIATLKRKNDWLYTRIESILIERDRWKYSFFEDSTAHVRAQAQLENQLVKTREMLAKAVKIIDGYRTKDGVPPLEPPFTDLFEGTGEFQKHQQLIKRLIDEAPPYVDYLKERREEFPLLGPDHLFHVEWCLKDWEEKKGCSCDHVPRMPERKSERKPELEQTP